MSTEVTDPALKQETFVALTKKQTSIRQSSFFASRLFEIFSTDAATRGVKDGLDFEAFAKMVRHPFLCVLLSVD
jgi:hypothetical protein